jgi:hypothetical protein
MWNTATFVPTQLCNKFVLRLTPDTELDILLSCPDFDEKDIFRGPGPTSTMSLLGETMVETYPVLLIPR